MISRRKFFRKTGLAALGGLGATVLGNVFPELKPAAAHRQGPLQPYNPYQATESGPPMEAAESGISGQEPEIEESEIEESEPPMEEESDMEEWDTGATADFSTNATSPLVDLDSKLGADFRLFEQF